MAQNEIDGVYTRLNHVHGSSQYTVYIFKGKVIETKEEYDYLVALSELNSLVSAGVEKFYYRDINSDDIVEGVVALLQDDLNDIIKLVNKFASAKLRYVK